MIGVFFVVVAALAFFGAGVVGLAVAAVSTMVAKSRRVESSNCLRIWTRGALGTAAIWAVGVLVFNEAPSGGPPTAEKWELVFNTYVLWCALPGVAVGGGGIWLLLTGRPSSEQQVHPDGTTAQSGGRVADPSQR